MAFYTKIILSKIVTSEAFQFITEQLRAALIRNTGRQGKLSKDKTRNTQCVKLTKRHDSVIRMVTFWCNLRINELEQRGVSPETIKNIKTCDARFLTSLSHAIAMQEEEEPEYDAWLFFNEDAQSTDFFELQYCMRGTKLTKACFVIQAER